jgi:hypothetical protein
MTGRREGVRPVHALSVLVLVFTLAAQGQSTSPGTAPPSQSPSQTPGSAPAETAPVSPNTQPLPDGPGSTSSRTASPAQPANPDQQAPPQQKGSIQRPLGTAAAGVINTSGVAASRPEGAALAPAKQRRVHLLIIKLGIVAAAGVALGTTMALTAASPSKPPGSH